MSAAQYNLSIACGEDFNFTLRVLDAFDDPIDFSNSSFIAEIREEHKKPLVAAFTIATVPNESGALKFSLTNDQTKLLSPTKQYKWDFFWTDSLGSVIKLLYGTVNAEANISNV